MLVFCLSTVSFANRDYLISVNLEYYVQNNSFSILDIIGTVSSKPESYSDEYTLFLYDKNQIIIDIVNFSISQGLYAPFFDENGETVVVEEKTLQTNLYLLYSPNITTLKILDKKNNLLLEEDITEKINQINYTEIQHIMIDEKVKDVYTAKQILKKQEQDKKIIENITPTNKTPINTNKKNISENKNDNSNQTIKNSQQNSNQNLEQNSTINSKPEQKSSSKLIISIILILIIILTLGIIFYLHSKNNNNNNISNNQNQNSP